MFYQANKKQRLDILIDTKRNNLIENLLSKKSIANSNFLSKYGNVLGEDEDDRGGDQTDSHRGIMQSLSFEHLEFIANRARGHWKAIARELKLIDECEILEIEHSQKISGLQEKLAFVLKLWWEKQQRMNQDENSNKCRHLEDLFGVLTACRLNKVKEELLMQLSA